MRRKVQLSLVLLLVFLGGCFFWGGKPEGVTDLAKEYAFIKGVLAAPPILERGNERLILYLLVTEPIEEKEDIVTAIAQNEEKEEILVELEQKLRETDEPVFLYGSEVHGRWEEFIQGVDFVIYAVGYYDPKAKKYRIVITEYGVGLLENVSWGEFLKAALKAGVKSGSKVVKP